MRGLKSAPRSRFALFVHRRRRNRIAEQIALSGVLRGYRTTEYVSLAGRCGGHACSPAGRRQVMLALAGIAIDANENAIRGVVILIFARPETNQRNDADGQHAEEKQSGKPVHRASDDKGNTAKPGVIGNEMPGLLASCFL